MSEADKKRILERLTNMRGEILSKMGPREQRYETERPPGRPYVFLRQRMEKMAKPGGMIADSPDLEGLSLVTAAIFRVIRFFWR